MDDGPRPFPRIIVGARTQVESVLAELVEMYDGPMGATNYDGTVTQLEHALQSAALAEAEGAEGAAVAAPLLHDIGHLVLDEHAGNEGFLKARTSSPRDCSGLLLSSRVRTERDAATSSATPYAPRPPTPPPPRARPR